MARQKPPSIEELNEAMRRATVTNSISPTLSTLNPRVYIDVRIGSQAAARLTIELFRNTVPQTANYFYKRFVMDPGYGIGTFTFFEINKREHRAWLRSTQTGALYGKPKPQHAVTPDAATVQHTERGLLSTPSGSITDHASAMFFICLQPQPQCDSEGGYTVFGRVIDGFSVLDKLDNIATEDGRPLTTARVIESGISHSTRTVDG